MAVREATRSTRTFAFKYFAQVHERVKKLEHERSALYPKRQPMIPNQAGSHFSPKSSGSSVTPETEVHAAEALKVTAGKIDDAGGPPPEIAAVAKHLVDIADKIDTVVDLKINRVQNRFSFATFRDAVNTVLQQLPQLDLRQRVVAVYHVGAGFFLQEDRNSGQGVQGTIQSWPDQYFEENPEFKDAMDKAGGLDNLLGSSVD